jgi:hypothetical protein
MLSRISSAGQFARSAARPVQGRDDRRRWLSVSVIVIKEPAARPTGESAMPYKVCGRDRHELGVVNLLERSDQLLIGALFVRLRDRMGTDCQTGAPCQRQLER